MRQQGKTHPEIERIWPLLPKPYGIVRWFARNADSTEIAGDFADSAASLSAAARAYSHLNFYLQPNPTGQRTKTRSSADDITHWSYLFIDVDPVDKNNADPVAALDFTLHKLMGLTGKNISPLTIDSGRGVQGWVRLEDLALSRTSDGAKTLEGWQQDWTPTRYEARAAANFVLTALDKMLVTEGAYHKQDTKGYLGCRVDVSCSDLPRLMRCPGTVNHKTGRMASILKDGMAHTLSRVLVDLTPAEQLVPRVIVERPGMKWQRVLNRLTLTAKTFIRKGTEEPGRHKRVSATLKSLRDNGISMDESRLALQEGNRKTLPPLDLQELERMIQAEYKTLDS